MRWISGEVALLGHLCGFGGSFRLEVLLVLSLAVLGGSAAAEKVCLRRLCPHRRHERPDAHDVHDTRKIVGEHVQYHPENPCDAQ